MEKRIIKAIPRGFCSGVENAVNMLHNALKQETEKIYVRKEIVHNTVMIEHFKTLGAVFVNEADEVPVGGTVVFSAHGVSPAVREMAYARNLKIIDATCPLVTKVHNEAIRFKEQGFTIILLGISGHKEVLGIIGEAPDSVILIESEKDIDNLTGIDGSRVAFLSQTTLNADETQRIAERLRDRFPLIHSSPESDICYATRNRQQAVKRIADKCDLFIVVGSGNSSNTKKLAETALEYGAAAVIRIDMPEELAATDFSSINTIGITSGASTPDSQFEGVIAYLREIGYTEEERTLHSDSNKEGAV